MSRSEPTSQLEAVLKAVANEPNGATLIDVAAQLSPPAAQRNVQRWLAVLVRQSRIVRVGDAPSSPYTLRDESTGNGAPAVSDVGQAIWRLVTQPLTERTPCGYHRDWLDGYRPNRTCFIPEPIRARLRASAATPSARAWRDPDHFNALATEAAWSSSCLEAELADGRPPSFSRADVTAWLTAPESANAWPEVQFVRNQRAAWQVLLSRGPEVALTYELLTALHGC